MQTFRIYFDEDEQGKVLRILSHYGGVWINDVGHRFIDIAMEHRDAEVLYGKLLEQLEREVYDLRIRYPVA